MLVIRCKARQHDLRSFSKSWFSYFRASPPRIWITCMWVVHLESSFESGAAAFCRTHHSCSASSKFKTETLGLEESCWSVNSSGDQSDAERSLSSLIVFKRLAASDLSSSCWDGRRFLHQRGFWSKEFWEGRQQSQVTKELSQILWDWIGSSRLAHLSCIARSVFVFPFFLSG